MNKIYAALILSLFLATGCKNNTVAEPKIVIDRATMVNIIYDLSVLEAMRSINSANGITYPKPNIYIKNNYNYDSITFAQNTKFYASNTADYKKMYTEVQERLLIDATKLTGGKKQIKSGELKN